MYGNRDFLMRQRFEEITGGRLVPDPLRIELYGEPTLLMHGDLLCTADTGYMKFRAMVRDPVWQGDFLAKDLAERNGIFNSYREISKATTTKKPPEIMDVAQSTVENVMRQYNVRRLIHGHTHRPGEHAFTLDGAPARRMVLGAWYEQGSVLRVDAGDGHSIHCRCQRRRKLAVNYWPRISSSVSRRKLAGSSNRPGSASKSVWKSTSSLVRTPVSLNRTGNP